jgi:hypothetical protein
MQVYESAGNVGAASAVVRLAPGVVEGGRCATSAIVNVPKTSATMTIAFISSPL